MFGWRILLMRLMFITFVMSACCCCFNHFVVVCSFLLLLESACEQAHTRCCYTTAWRGWSSISGGPSNVQTMPSLLINIQTYVICVDISPSLLPRSSSQLVAALCRCVVPSLLFFFSCNNGDDDDDDASAGRLEVKMQYPKYTHTHNTLPMHTESRFICAS